MYWYGQWILFRIPMERVEVAEDLAGTAILLTFSASDYVTGQVLFIGGG